MTDPEQREQPAPRGPGRPSKLTDERQQRIVDAVTAGNYLKVAAQWAGISDRTLTSWLARGRAAEQAEAAHTEGHRYCPSCDLDREAELLPIEQANDEADRVYAAQLAEHAALVEATGPDDEHPPTPAHGGYGVPGRCPTCGSDAYPDTWQLDDTEGEYLRFLRAVTRAEVSAEVAAVTAIRSAFGDDWRAAQAYLVRRRPERWAATTRVQMTTEESERRIDDALAEALAAITGDDDTVLDDLDLDGEPGDE